MAWTACGTKSAICYRGKRQASSPLHGNQRIARGRESPCGTGTGTVNAKKVLCERSMIQDPKEDSQNRHGGQQSDIHGHAFTTISTSTPTSPSRTFAPSTRFSKSNTAPVRQHCGVWPSHQRIKKFESRRPPKKLIRSIVVSLVVGLAARRASKKPKLHEPLPA